MGKPVLAVDIDDTICDYVGDFLPFLKRNGIDLRRDELYYSLTAMGIPKELFEKFEHSGHLLDLKPVPDSQLAISQLSDLYTIDAVTSRGEHLRYDTMRWMDKYFPQVNNIHFDRNKGAVCREIHAVALVDDAIRFAMQFSPSFVLAQPWNYAYSYPSRGNWAFILNALTLLGRTLEFVGDHERLTKIASLSKEIAGDPFRSVAAITLLGGRK